MTSDDSVRRGARNFVILVAASAAVIITSAAMDDTPSGETWQLEQHTVQRRTLDCVVVRNGTRQQITAIDCDEVTR